MQVAPLVAARAELQVLAQQLLTGQAQQMTALPPLYCLWALTMLYQLQQQAVGAVRVWRQALIPSSRMAAAGLGRAAAGLPQRGRS